jgi:hypothetical protein
VEFDKVADAVLVDQSKGVDTKTLHHSIASWYTSIGHSPHKHVRRLGVQVLEVPEVVMSALTLRNFSIWLWFDGMNWSKSSVNKS